MDIIWILYTVGFIIYNPTVRCCPEGLTQDFLLMSSQGFFFPPFVTLASVIDLNITLHQTNSTQTALC